MSGLVITQRISVITICGATLALGIGYAAAGFWILLPVFAFLVGLWLSLRPRGWGWVHSIALLLYTCMAAFGILVKTPAVWMLLCLAAVLSAWDLEYFLRRVKSVEDDETKRLLAHQHLQRLAAVIGLGLVLAGAAMTIRTRFTLGVGMLVGLLAVLALSQVVGYLRRESD
jgi:hypothetical protein